MGFKKCTTCLDLLNTDLFSRTKFTKDGLYSCCKECRRISHQKRILENVVPIEDLPCEIWKSIDINNKYSISNMGRCKSHRRKGKWHDAIIKISMGKRGYPTYNILGRTMYIHRLMAIAFIPNPLKLPQVHHIDDNKMNFSLSNLKCGINRDNVIDAHNNGLCNPPKGERNGSAKLKEKQVISILKSNDRYKKLAFKYNVSISLISKIKQREIWMHINP